MKLEIKNASENSKGITHTVMTDGHIVAHVREADLAGFLAEQEAKNAAPLELKSNGYREAYLVAEFKVAAVVGRGTKAYVSCTIGFSPEGKDLTGTGKSVFINQHGFMLTDSYMRPEALKMVGPEMILETSHGTFKITQDKRGYYHAEKIQ